MGDCPDHKVAVILLAYKIPLDITVCKLDIMVVEGMLVSDVKKLAVGRSIFLEV